MNGTLTVTTAPGLEGLLAEELTELRLKPDEVSFGSVRFSGTWKSVARVLLRCRLGSRLLLKVSEFSARHEAMLYNQVRRVEWGKWFSPAQTFSVRVLGDFSGTSMARTFAPLKIKDAICDEFRKQTGERPSVDRDDPDVPIVAFFRKGRCEISIELAGEPMHRRGYRLDAGAAPLKEHRAAALLRFVGYDGSRPFVDPFCGSGTIVIEAAMLAAGRPPGLLRNPDRFTASRISPDARAAIQSTWNGAKTAPVETPQHTICGGDIDAACVAAARANAARAGCADLVQFNVADARSINAPRADIVSNPPFGERIGATDDAIALLTSFTGQVRSHCPGARLGLMLPFGPMTKNVGLRSDRKLPVSSAPLELRFMKFSIFEPAD